MSLTERSDQQLQFSPVALKDIDSELAKLFSSPDDENVRYVRIGTSNLIMICSCSCRGCKQDQLITLLGDVQPGRFFVVCLKEVGNEIEASISARCTRFNEHEHLCSEVVRLVVPKSRIKALPSVIWANTLTGMPAELFWNCSVVDPDLLNLFLPLISRTIIDSAHLEDATSILRSLVAVCNGTSANKLIVVDLQWLRLLGWRDVLSQIFSEIDGENSFADLKSITFRYGAPKQKNSLEFVYLFAGWILSAAQCRSWCMDDGHFKCVRGDGEFFDLTFKGFESNRDHDSIEIEIKPSGGGTISIVPLNNSLTVSLVVDGHTDVRECKLPSASPNELLEKFYLYGREMSGYQEAIGIALNLKALLAGVHKG